MKKILFILIALEFLFYNANAKTIIPSTKRKPSNFVLTQEEDSDPPLTTISLAEQKINWIEPDMRTLGGPFVNSETPTVAETIGLAKQTIDIEIYEMGDPGVRAALRQALAKETPVRIRIIKEPKPVGEKCDPMGTAGLKKAPAKGKKSAQVDCLEQQSLIQEILKKGGSFVAFNKEQLCGQLEKKGRCFQHGKLIIIDKTKLALISTGNFNASNLCDIQYNPDKCNRDYSYITRDPEVLTGLNEIFEKDLKGERYDLKALLIKNKIYNKLTVSPYSFEPLKEFILTAQASIQIQNQYINPDSGLAEVLLQKAKEWHLTEKLDTGKKIEVLLTDVCFFGKVSEKKAYQLHLIFSALEAAGIQIRMFTDNHMIKGRPGYLHAKAIVIDSQKAWIGSVNGSTTSLNQNREFGIFFTHPSRVEQLGLFLDADFQDASNQTWRDSLLCRKLGYQTNLSIKTATDTDYVKKINSFSQGTGAAEVDED